MNRQLFWQEFEERIGRYDLLKHPFYKAWSAGELSRQVISKYATQYYHHVAAFPRYLQLLKNRLPEGPTRKAVEQNRQDEMGGYSSDGRAHDELWLDFAEGMGAERKQVPQSKPMAEVNNVIESFERYAAEGEVVEALCAFYAYESQVPRVAGEKEHWLRELYGADATTSNYFREHATADIHHSNVWRGLIDRELTQHPEMQEVALNTGEKAAESLWHVLDGMQKAWLEAAPAC